MDRIPFRRANRETVTQGGFICLEVAILGYVSTPGNASRSTCLTVNPDYNDLDEVPDPVASATVAAARNAVHSAQVLKSANYPTYE